MITKDMSIGEIMDLDERACSILMAHGLFCQGCPGAESETLEEAAKGHDISFNKLLDDLNEMFKHEV